MDELEKTIKEFQQRLTALENKQPNRVTPEELTEALESNPLFQRVSAFLARWGNKQHD